MADLVAKHSNYVTRVVQAVDNFMSAHEEMMLLLEEYDALDYGNQLLPAAFDGNNAHLGMADIVAVMVTHAAIETVMDAGHRTNLMTTRG